MHLRLEICRAMVWFFLAIFIADSTKNFGFENGDFAVIDTSGLSSPYKDVQLFPFNDQTMYVNSSQLKSLIEDYKVLTIIEIGSWVGASTRHMASLLPSNGKIYAVDHWLGSTEHQGDPLLPLLYEVFLSNVIHTGLTHKIIPVKMESLEAARYLTGVRPDLIYIDASHDTGSVLNDLKAWFPYVKGSGILCGDDAAWPSVLDAVRIFAEENHLKIDISDNFWRLVE